MYRMYFTILFFITCFFFIQSYWIEKDMYTISYFLKELTSFIMPVLYPLEKDWIQDYRQMMEPKNFIKNEYINEVEIQLPKNDHRNEQEIYLTEKKRKLYKLYIPKEKKNLKTILWFHGGGFVVGNIRAENDMCIELANKTNAIVVNINYALAPENKFPQALKDTINAINWVKSNIKKYNGSKSLIYLAGESAGGNLVLSVAHKVKNIKGIISIYPPLHAFSNYKSHWKYANYNGFLTLNIMQKFYWNYLSTILESQTPDVSPNLLPNSKLKLFPKTLLILAKYDILYDEGLYFSKRLQENNVSTIVKSYGDIHGFFNRFGHGKKAFNEIIEFLN